MGIHEEGLSNAFPVFTPDEVMNNFVSNKKTRKFMDGLRKEGIGYAHTMSLRIPIPHGPRKQSTLDTRWLTRWSAPCVLESKRADDPADTFRVLRDAFDRRMRALLAANIAWTVITHQDLDSPLRSGTEFDRALCLAIERRRCRMGRTKGKGKKYAKHK